MQNPTMNTPVARCIQLSRFAERMLRKANNPTLSALADLLAGRRSELENKQTDYANAIMAIIDTRADLRWINWEADRLVRAVLKDAEKADGKQGGRISKAIAPEGITMIVRSTGQTQVDEMKKFEGYLVAAAPLWADASAQLAIVSAMRQTYENGVLARKTAGETAALKRHARNAAKEDLITVYAKVTSSVKAEFPRQKEFQDLFFDEVRSEPELSADSDDEDEGPVPTTDAGTTPA